MGTRLRSVVPGKPKPLAEVGSRSFLELLVRQLRHQGIEHLVLCTGYLAEQIEKEFGNGSRLGVTIEYSAEQTPLGTGGALKLAQAHLKNASRFLVMNGDSFLEADFRSILSFHDKHEGLATIAVVSVASAERYGTVNKDSTGRILGFREKTGDAKPGLVNAGVYVFDQRIFAHIPEGPTSLEREVFPRLLPKGLYAIEQNGLFIDIGTPEDYARAHAICDRLESAALGS